MDSFLVTGGAGFIGSNICRELVSKGCFVRIVDNLVTGKRENLTDISDKVEFIEGDMGDEDIARAAMKDIDIVLHQGALPSVPRSIADPAATHKSCVDATFTLLVAARDAKIKRFVYASSSSIYGDTPTLLKRETMCPSPLSPYAVGKLVGEYYCFVFHRVFGLETISLRYFNVFGPRQDPTSQYAAAIPAFVRAALTGRQPLVYGDGKQSRDFTYVDNVVEANLLAAGAEHTAGEAVNIACGESVTINDVIGIIGEIAGVPLKPVYCDWRPGDVRHSLADIKIAGSLINYRPVVSLWEGLRKTVDWYRQNAI